MPVTPFDHLALAHPRRNRWRLRVWREWCFLRVLGRHFAVRAIIMLAVLNGGALLFKTLGPERDMPYLKALWSAWLLIFAETPPYDFPDSLVLDLMYFVMPILGLTVIIEGIIDFALVLRDRKRSERSWCVMMASQLRNHIVLVGFGKLGYSTYLLLRRLGESVVVVERDPNNQFFEELRRDGVPLLIGDARRDVLLGDANIAHAKSIIVATNDDLANLEVALDARRINPRIRVVLRMFDQNMANKVGEGFNIHQSMSQSAVSAPAFAMSAVEPSIIHSFIVGDDLVVLQRWDVRPGGPLMGMTIADIMARHGVSIVKLRRGPSEAALFPPPATTIHEGDSLLVQGPYEVLRRLAEYATAMS
ncbi:MAG: potassium channel protein [Phycisphaeraceae bacterium]|nr:NAD-binding protein [Phycisphaerales bacterium]QOJ16506.1 MAG: potassium channel protein [Phycisphaeraceae bacterium]